MNSHEILQSGYDDLFQVDQVDRDAQALVLDQVIQDSGLADRLTSEEDRSKFVHELDGPGFVGLVRSMHIALLGDSDGSGKFAEEVNIIFNGETNKPVDIMPAPEDKEHLLHDVLRNTQRLDNPKLQAVALGFGINAVHPFMDGNGRVSRAVYTLISKNYKPRDEQLLGALGENGDSVAMLDANIFTPTAYLLTKDFLGSHYPGKDGYHFEPKVKPVITDVDWLKDDVLETPNRKFDLDQCLDMKMLFNSGEASEIVSYLMSQNTESPGVKTATRDIEGRTYFLYDEFLKNATDKEMDMLYVCFRQVKTTYIKILMRTLAQDNVQDMALPHQDAPEQRLSLLRFGRLATSHSFINKP